MATATAVGVRSYRSDLRGEWIGRHQAARHLDEGGSVVVLALLAAPSEREGGTVASASHGLTTRIGNGPAKLYLCPDFGHSTVGP
jgi:hypothetical protein